MKLIFLVIKKSKIEKKSDTWDGLNNFEQQCFLLAKFTWL